MSRSIATCIAAGILFFLACGRTEGGTTSDAGSDAASPPPPPGTPPPAPPPAPVVADAGFDAPIVYCEAGACTLPPSYCIDDDDMRYFYDAHCTDAGTCDYGVADIHCDPSGMKPECYQGACRLVVVR